MKKVWTTKDGVIGTHHKNRKGYFVDFRPASRIEPVAIPNGDKPYLYSVKVVPPKGQNIPALILEVEKKESIAEEESLSFKIIKYRLISSFGGVSISIPSIVNERIFKSEEREREFFALQEKRMEERSSRVEKTREFIRGISSDKVVSFLNLSRRELGRLESGRLNIYLLIKETIEKMVGVNDNNLSSEKEALMKRLVEKEDIKKLILIREEERRQKRKNEWIPFTH